MIILNKINKKEYSPDCKILNQICIKLFNNLLYLFIEQEIMFQVFRTPKRFSYSTGKLQKFVPDFKPN